MPESALVHQSDVFPFPPTPRFTNLTEVCKYLNNCGFDITWQSFHRTYSTYIKHHRAVIRQLMRAHGIETKIGEPSMHDKISMLIVRGMLDDHLRHILVETIQKRAFANRIQVVQRLYRYALAVRPPKGMTRQKMMLAHLDAVLEAMIESLDAYNGGETNQGYLNRLYRASIQSTMASVHIIRRPEQWFVVMENQQDMNVDVVAPGFARSYTSLFKTFSGLLSDEEPDLNNLVDQMSAAKNLDAEIQKAASNPKASVLEARAILSSVSKKEAAMKSADASKETRNLVRLMRKREKLKAEMTGIVNEGRTLQAAMEIREEMKKAMRSFGCSPSTEKKLYRGCGVLIEDIDHGIITPDEFDERAYDLVHTELRSIAARSVADTMAHAAVIDYRVADFISDIFNVNRDTFEAYRFDFAQHIARYMSHESEPQSSDSGVISGVMG